MREFAKAQNWEVVFEVEEKISGRKMARSGTQKLINQGYIEYGIDDLTQFGNNNNLQSLANISKDLAKITNSPSFTIRKNASYSRIAKHLGISIALVQRVVNRHKSYIT